MSIKLSCKDFFFLKKKKKKNHDFNILFIYNGFQNNFLMKLLTFFNIFFIIIFIL